jgi:hypothetical protein
MRKALFAALVFLCGGRAEAGTIYNDGGTHTVNGPSADITVSNATTLNVVSGAAIQGASSNPGIETSGGSTLNISGGTIAGATGSGLPGEGVFAEASNVTISGGTLTGGAVASLASNGLTFFFSPTQTGAGSNTLSITGGMFRGGVGSGVRGVSAFIDTGGSTTSSISGGSFPNALSMLLSGSSTVTISGGNFSEIDINIFDHTIVSFLGSGLSLSRVSGPNFIITGTLLDGESISTPVFIPGPFGLSETSSQITLFGVKPLAPVPEPASVVMFGIGLAVVAGLAWRSRREHSAPNTRLA